MKQESYEEFSVELGRTMAFKVYGTAGLPILVFPAQDKRFYDFEENGMIETVKNYIEEEKIQIFACDSIDSETWSLKKGNEHERIVLHEAWYDYITKELVKRIHELNHSVTRIMTAGCSMGASHAMNFFLRRPDLFKGTIALSGVYNMEYFFPNYQDPLIYNNSPLQYLYNMPKDHPYVKLYQDSDIIACVGQGAFEDPMLYDTHALKQQFLRLHVDAWIDFWGVDVNHDWPWWRKQFPYFISHLV